MTYDFHTQKQLGEWGASILDRIISPHAHLERASLPLERQGIDRIAHLSFGIYYVEYKTDFRAHSTGNAFIETISADDGRRAQGWAVTSKS